MIKLLCGDVPERLIGLVSKTSMAVRSSGVRIPPSPHSGAFNTIILLIKLSHHSSHHSEDLQFLVRIKGWILWVGGFKISETAASVSF